MKAAWLLVVASAVIARAQPLRSNASDACHGHGEVYPEERSLGVTTCACYQCYTGPTCDALLPGCALETRVAEATLFQDWFTAWGDALSINVGPEYHLGYLQSPRVFPPFGAEPAPVDAISQMLNTSIRELHRVVQNVEGDAMTLVVGDGGVQLIDAALYALTQGPNAGKRMHVYAQPPFYPHFAMASGLNPLTNFTLQREALDPSTTIEVLTIPNNPDNRLKVPQVPTATARITDLVYFWPHYLNESVGSARQDDIMIFSFSKLTGYAASRLGWAFVRDPEVANRMSYYMWLQSTAPAVESQLRAVKVLRAVTDSYRTEADFFQAARRTLAARWQQLRQIFAMQSRFQLNGTDGGLFMWVECMSSGDRNDCAALFATVGITTENGTSFGASPAFARICMGHDNSTFELLVARLMRLMQNDRAEPQTPVHDLLVSDDWQRASTWKPRDTFRGAGAAEMARVLNGHLEKYQSANLTLVDCATASVTDLHATERQLQEARAMGLQMLYLQARDPRAAAFGGAPDAKLALVHPWEATLAAASPEHEALVREALCHRLVMQYVHHLSRQQRATLQHVRLPRLPELRRAGAARSRRTISAEQEWSLAQAAAVYDNATQCARCHLLALLTTPGSDGRLPTKVSATPATSLPPAPFVPLWPVEFDVKFGLYLDLPFQQLRNSSSHMFYSSLLPSMHIAHSVCPQRFLPQLPLVTGPCNLTFHANGLWFVWPGTAGAVSNCCQVIKADMTANLGRNELGGFLFLGNVSTTDYYGRSVLAEAWTPGPVFPQPTGFRLLVDPQTNEDVHYHNGGPYALEWWLQRRAVRAQDPSVFQLPANPSCDAMCVGSAAPVDQQPSPHLHALHTLFHGPQPDQR